MTSSIAPPTAAGSAARTGAHSAARTDARRKTGIRRTEGPEKLCGLARYVDDYDLPGCLHGATLRSTIPYGNIRRIHFDASFPWDEFVVVTAEDIPGQNVAFLIEEDQPLLAADRVMHAMEPIVLVAHEDRARAYEALKHIQVEVEELEPVLSVENALARKQRLYGDDNVFKSLRIDKGDVERGLAEADYVVEGEYRVPHQEQAYIENNGMAAWFDDDGRLVVLGSMQCPYYVEKALMRVFDLPAERIRVVQAVTGGGFGGKEEYPNLIAGHAALLAHKAGRPVKMIYDRHEDMLATTKRHPAIVRHRTGVSRDGELLAQDIDILMDGGAYVTLSPVVLSRGILHATGPYECPHARLRARVVATNTPPNGAFRGFGAPQTLFAAELHWERIAETLGIDSLTLRRRNLVRQGSSLATGQVLDESVGAEMVLERCVARTAYERKRREYARWNRRRSHPTWKGIGLAVAHHGAGFTGSGEVYLASRAGLSLRRDGSIRVLAASTEIGQGTNSLFTQIVAQTLDVDHAQIEVQTPDTDAVPDSGPTVASRTCMVVGSLLVRACQELRAELERRAGGVPRTRAAWRAAAATLCGSSPSREFVTEYEPPPGVRWDEEHYRGDAYAVYSYECCVVDLEVDKLTYEVRVNDFTAVADIGHAVHPLLAEGQVIGGSAQGLGYALQENVVFAEGRMANPQLTNYIIPTALDTPPMHVEFVDDEYPGGPFGAKGVGELPMDVPAPAVAAALHHATGAWFPRLPILPETIARGLRDPSHRQ